MYSPKQMQKTLQFIIGILSLFLLSNNSFAQDLPAKDSVAQINVKLIGIFNQKTPQKYTHTNTQTHTQTQIQTQTHTNTHTTVITTRRPICHLARTRHRGSSNGAHTRALRHTYRRFTSQVRTISRLA